MLPLGGQGFVSGTPDTKGFSHGAATRHSRAARAHTGKSHGKRKRFFSLFFGLRLNPEKKEIVGGIWLRGLWLSANSGTTRPKKMC